jgi:hemolysin activation/secretion protein
MRYFRSQAPLRSFFASISGTFSHNLNINQQVVLGGDTGARGYDSRFQTGDHRIVLTLEERQYTDWHILNLVRPGFAIFVDAGRVWQAGISDNLKDKYLLNAGFGIRLASSKADVGSIVHIDFAFPLTNRNEQDVDSLQITVNIKKSL